MAKGKINREDLVQTFAKKRLEDKLSNFQMVEILMNEFGYQKSYAYGIVKDARAKIAEVYSDYTFKLLEQTIGDLEAQKRDAKKNGDNKLVLEITKEINKISGLYIDRVQIGGELSFNVKFPGMDNDDDQLI